MKIDYIGKKFGFLTVVSLSRVVSQKQYWNCKCECGNIVEKMSNYLTRKRGRHHCGCKDKYASLEGQIFGRLTIIEKTRSRKGIAWLCKCTCGNLIVLETGRFINGKTSSCGCIKTKYARNMLGRKFGNLLVLSKQEIPKNPKHVEWICQCDCGKIIENVVTDSIASGRKSSCGCKSDDHLKQYRISKGQNPEECLMPKNALARSGSRSKRKKILLRDDAKCVLCSSSATLEIHHIVALKETLEQCNNDRNLVTLCKKCHRTKAHDNYRGTNIEIQQQLFKYIENIYCKINSNVKPVNQDF